MKGVEIPFTNSTKYLGIIFDSKLNWTPHMTNKLAKGKQILMMA